MTASSDVARILQQAFQYHQRGEFAAAEQGYRRVLSAHPNQPDANHLLGVLLGQTGQGEAGAALIRRALDAAPENADAHCNLGRVLEGLGRIDEAVASYRVALARRPDFDQALFNLGAAQRKLGQLDEAIDAYQRLIERVPGHAKALFNLGNALKDARRSPEAIESYRRALAADPGLTTARVNLANTLGDSGELSTAVQLLVEAITREPESAGACQSLALLLRGRTLEAGENGGATRAALLACLRRDDIDYQDIVTAATSVVLHDAPPAVSRGLGGLDTAAQRAAFADADVARFLSEPLLERLLSKTVLMDVDLEIFLAGLRAAVLDVVVHGDEAPGRDPGSLEGQAHWLAPLAMQCFRNEYVYPESPPECAGVEKLKERVLAKLESGAGIDERLALLGCYRPLHELPNAHALAQRSGPPWWTELARVQILEPLEERALAADLPRLPGKSRPVSEAVRRQYEENPYPRWTGLYHGRVAPFLDWLSREVDPALLKDAPPIAAPRVLIAGCGTGLHALTCALEYSGAELLAIDLSVASLAYAQRCASELNIENVEFLQADLLDLDALDRRFDVIESVGVLHHLADPVAGWRVLRRLLAPGGYMKIGLYSELARSHIVAARDYLAANGFPATPSGIRAARAELLALPDDAPARGVVTSGDFYSASGMRDLLLHVQEHRFSLPEIARITEELSLAPLGFVVDEAVRRDYRVSEPGDTHAVSLAGWARYEEAHPGTFQSMYQLWLQAVD